MVDSKFNKILKLQEIQMRNLNDQGKETLIKGFWFCPRCKSKFEHFWIKVTLFRAPQNTTSISLKNMNFWLA